MAGYSQTPLAKKLGIKAGFSAKLVNEPAHYFGLFSDMPEPINFDGTKGPYDFIHLFVSQQAVLAKELPALKKQLKPAGMIWVSWPKKASGVATNVSENLIRDLALSIGLVDIKVCAVDETWSGLKLVVPVKDREGKK